MLKNKYVLGGVGGYVVPQEKKKAEPSTQRSHGEKQMFPWLPQQSIKLSKKNINPGEKKKNR